MSEEEKRKKFEELDTKTVLSALILNHKLMWLVIGVVVLNTVASTAISLFISTRLSVQPADVKQEVLIVRGDVIRLKETQAEILKALLLMNSSAKIEAEKVE